MITASHNPFYDNGIKVIDREGYKMSDDVLEKIEEYLDGKTEITFAHNDSIRKDYRLYSGKKSVHQLLNLGYCPVFPGIIRWLWIAANGPPAVLQRRYFEMLGAKT